MIAKKPVLKNQFQRYWSYKNSSREAWYEIIENFKVMHPGGRILLPAYIGWSVNEGSGILDPVVKSGIDFEFYAMGMQLQIDFDDLLSKVEENANSLVLLVHYFGFPDVSYNKIATWLEENNVFFVEDCAHAWLTDLVGGVCGKRGRFSFYSLHKLLPMSTGGILVDNSPSNTDTWSLSPYCDLKYDLYSIYKRRRSNYIYLLRRIIDVDGVEILYDKLNKGICPQTMPVIIKSFDRNILYTKMNDAGFGLVSLYHTMIDSLKNSSFEAPKKLAPVIINLPVHQDITFDDIDAMVNELKGIMNV